MLSRSDETQERFPEQERVIRDIEAAIVEIRRVKSKMLPELTALVERLNQLEGALELLSRIGKKG